MSHFLFVLILCLTWHTSTSVHGSTDIRVHTPFSTYVGSRLQLERFEGVRPSVRVDQFLGIRYGLVPTSVRRFTKSQPSWLDSEAQVSPIEKYQKEIEAKQWPPACQQQPGFVEMQLQNKERSEDCLFLNVWTPVPKKENADANLKPVLVWFHGGSFISDSSSRKLYLGSHLTAAADVIVVTVNYRLDTFGFLYSGPKILNQTESAVGNQALWDQLLALEWVQEHIEYFGGDPARVTIAGQNSGATSVGAHLLSPKSRSFFHRAILMSGSIFSQLVAGKASLQNQVAEMWAEASSRKLKCGHGAHWTVETLKCLQRASSEDLLKLLDPLAQPSLSPEIVLGDQLLPFDNLLEAISDLPKSNKKIQILLGTTDDEGSLVLPLLNMEIFSLLQPKQLSRDEAYEQLAKLSSMLVLPRGTGQGKIDGHEVARHYVNNNQKSSTPNYVRTIGQALGDFYVSCPVVELAKQLTSNSESSVELYQYLWSKKFPSKEVPCADWMGACHGADVVMLFGQPFELRDEYTPEHRKLSVHFMKTIGEFVHTGKPMKQEGKQWPPHSRDKNDAKKLLTPYYEFADSSASKSRIYRGDWKREICADLWAKYLLPKV